MSRHDKAVLPQLRGVTVLLTAVGLGLGYHGFTRLDAASSMADRVYATLQLLVLAGPSGVGTQEIPVSLGVGRYLAAVGLAGTVGALIVRMGVTRADLVRASRANHHVVVVGSTPEAQRMAVARRTKGRRFRSMVVLIGDFDEHDDIRLRRSRVRVVPKSAGGAIGSAVQGADEVVIAEADDGQAVGMLDAVVAGLASGRSDSAADRSRVRVLVRTTSLARELRGRFAGETDRGVVVTALSVVEAASYHLTGEQWFPEVEPGRGTHLVVVGGGDLARETATSLVERRCSQGNTARLDLMSVAGVGWCDTVRRRVERRDVAVSVLELESDADEISSAIRKECVDGSFVHQVYLIGVSDGVALAVAMRLSQTAPSVRVVAVLDEWRSDPDRMENSLGRWSVATMPDLLAEPTMWALDELLARSILGALALLSSLPGSERELGSIKHVLNRPEREQKRWALGVAGNLQSDLARCGLMMAPVDTAAEPLVLMSDALMAMRNSLMVAFHSIGAPSTNDGALMSVLSVLQELPEMLRQCGYALLVAPGADSADAGPQLSEEQVEQLAIQLHEAYVRRSAEPQMSGSAVASRSWQELSVDHQASNRAQARDIPVKLLRLGYRIVSAQAEGARMPVITEADLERMAWFEHLRWMYSRRSNGWRYGPDRDDSRRIHPLIIPYEDLPVMNKRHDRGPIELLPELLTSVGLAVVEAGDLPATQ